MECKIDKHEKYAVYTVQEEKLNSLVSPELKSEFLFANNNGIKNIVLDLSSTLYCDSSGLSAILVGNRLCKSAQGTFVITGVRESVEKLIKISQLDQVLNITPSIEEAVEFHYMEEIERELKNE